MSGGSGAGGVTLLVLIALGVWFWQGDPARDVRRLVGQSSYDDQRESLGTFLSKNRIGSAPDVWLVKDNFETDRVAAFFGYADDMEACQEFARYYVQRYPAALYHCEYVR